MKSCHHHSIPTNTAIFKWKGPGSCALARCEHRLELPSPFEEFPGLRGTRNRRERRENLSGIIQINECLHWLYIPLGGGFKYFLCSPLLWGRFPIWLYNILQMGWNHQLDPISDWHRWWTTWNSNIAPPGAMIWIQELITQLVFVGGVEWGIGFSGSSCFSMTFWWWTLHHVKEYDEKQLDRVDSFFFGWPPVVDSPSPSKDGKWCLQTTEEANCLVLKTKTRWLNYQLWIQPMSSLDPTHEFFGSNPWVLERWIADATVLGVVAELPLWMVL